MKKLTLTLSFSAQLLFGLISCQEKSDDWAPRDQANVTIDFNRADTDYQKSHYVADFGNDQNQDGISSYFENYVLRTQNKNNTWQIKLLANKVGYEGGMWTYVSIPANTVKKTLEYDVKFGSKENPFEWGMGGKIPGLGGGANYSGCVSTKSGDGWTSRIMWRKDEFGKAYLMPYVYYVDKPEICGDNFDVKYYGAGGTGLESDVWYKIKMFVQLNTAINYDGVLKITVQEQRGNQWGESKILLEKNNIRFATNTNGLEIDQVLTGIFRGGSTMDWSTYKDTYVYIDNIKWYD